ncbi:hypothetical protein LPJ61_001202 [Coemansia biformis]|uniref:Zn(2)-C6 fungal-type domain-containing protein n=1 Tax=Coemansia biformis TaxID=1286918 RepID=A0A9W7YH60_9FUNG|nr:hypothetical protein LPJ61_001202 [Coemansia biformis]
MMNTGTAQQPQPRPFSPLSPAVSHPQLVRFRHSCEHCRKRKIKCSGTRPICEHCNRRGIECVYKPQAKSTRRPGSGMSSPLVGGSRPSSSLKQQQQQQFALNSSVQPISIPAANPYLHLPFVPSLHSADARYASAPIHTASPLTSGAYGIHHVPPSASSMRPASALPPHMSTEASGAKDDMFASLQSPQLVSMLGYSPASDLSGAVADSFGSIYGDTLDGSWFQDSDARAGTAPHGHRPATAGTAASASSLGAGLPQTLYHQNAFGLPPSLSAPQTAPARQTAFSFAAPPQLPSLGGGGGGGGGDASALGDGQHDSGDQPRHQRSLTSGSSSGSVSNMPLMDGSAMLGAVGSPAAHPAASLGGVYMYHHQHNHYLSSSMPSFAGGDGMFAGAGYMGGGSVLPQAKAGADDGAYQDLISSLGAIPHGLGDEDDGSEAFGAFVHASETTGNAPQQHTAMEVDPSGIAPEMTMLGDTLVTGSAGAKGGTNGAPASVGSRRP